MQMIPAMMKRIKTKAPSPMMMYMYILSTGAAPAMVGIWWTSGGDAFRGAAEVKVLTLQFHYGANLSWVSLHVESHGGFPDLIPLNKGIKIEVILLIVEDGAILGVVSVESDGGIVGPYSWQTAVQLPAPTVQRIEQQQSLSVQTSTSGLDLSAPASQVSSAPQDPCLKQQTRI